MAIDPNGREFYIILGATIFIVLLKLSVSIYLIKKIINKKKQDELMGLDFIKGIAGFILGLLISRVFYIIFDFYYTKFDINTYYLEPNIWFWKIGMFFANLGIAYVVYITDKKIIQNKYKGIFAYIIVLSAIITIFWPVNSVDDFNTLSAIIIIPTLGTIFIPVIFLNIGRNSTGELRKVSFTMVFAMLLYAFAAIIVNASFINFINTQFNTDLILPFYLTRALLKTIGIILFAYCATKFRA